ncbi:putative glycosyltransferase MJ1607 [Proteiniborus sp. DW1]|uniref:glycosyltransferase family 4 protein n=1 Tax=Proteiniborus sp. DW1 TaxID=1889883 RepID=UPI00092E0AFA|nr:glycosyltransferase family 4 protein [Proteiniborus sp. DW1]SCG83244.1 putative glycosyltransferase MJ1607 [Proteiniborus sp. DW1]
MNSKPEKNPVNKSITDVLNKKSTTKKGRLSIILVTYEYPTDERRTPGGGIGTVYYELANGLSSIGHDVSVITHTRIKETSYFENGVHVYKIFPMYYQSEEHAKFKRPTLKSLYWSNAVSKKLISILNEKKIDIIQFPELDGQGYCFLKDIKEQPVSNYNENKFITIIRLHSFTKYYRKAKNILSVVDHQRLELEKAALQNCDLVISSCHATAKAAKKYMNLKSLEYEIIPNSIDSCFFRPNKRKTEDDSKENFVFGYVGKIRHAKGVDNIIKAFSVIAAENDKVELILIGREREYAYSLIKSLDEEIKERIKVIGQIPREELVEYYKKFDCFILASRYESFPNTLLEAMSCGVPIIASNVGCVKEIIGESSNIIFNPENVEQLIKAMKTMLKKPYIREQAASYNRKSVESNYSRKKIAKKYVKLYQKVLRK